MKLRILKLSMLAVFLSACEGIFLPEDPSTDNQAIFDQAWTFVDENYSFFESKNIDWNAVKDEYEPQAIAASNDEELFNVLADMLFVLKDGHVNLSSSFNLARNWDWYLDSPSNFDFDLLERNYFNDQQQYVGSFVVMDFKEEKIGYFYYSSFVNLISEDDLDYIINKFDGYKGVILDIRGNGGGLVTNASTLASRVDFETETVVALEDSKIGPEHDAFSELKELTVAPSSGAKYPGTFVLLTNRSSYSAANMCATYMRSLNVPIIGDSSGGGGGLPVGMELSNGWVLRCSGTRLFSPDGINVEFGVPPTIAVDFTDSSYVNGVDPILQSAFEFIRNQ